MSALFDVGLKSDDKTYSKNIAIPQYLPDKVKPNIVELCDLTKYSKLIRDINNSDVSEEEKKFLRFAASRHIVFNYAKIADYYANSDSNLQKLMEDSALVIIDVDDAIANGYVKLSKNVNKLIEDSGVVASE